MWTCQECTGITKKTIWLSEWESRRRRGHSTDKYKILDLQYFPSAIWNYHSFPVFWLPWCLCRSPMPDLSPSLWRKYVFFSSPFFSCFLFASGFQKFLLLYVWICFSFCSFSLGFIVLHVSYDLKSLNLEILNINSSNIVSALFSVSFHSETQLHII